MHAWNLSSLDELAVVLLLLGIAALFVLIKYLADALSLRGFSSIAGHVRALSRLVHGERTRDGKDLVIRGQYVGIPVVIRLSRTDNVPELNIRMRAEVRCNLFVAPARAHVTEGAARVQVLHPLLNARCSVRTDHLLEARALLRVRQITDELWNLCCSSESFVSIANGNLEFSEAQLPTPDTIGWILRHLRSMSIIAAAAQGKPAPRERVSPRRARPALLRAAFAGTALLVVGLMTYLWGGTLVGRKNAVEASSQLESEIPAADAARLFGVGAWRLVRPSDFDPRAVQWVRDRGGEIAGRIAGQFGAGDEPGVSYVLVDDQTKSKRVVVLVRGAVKFDQTFTALDLAVRLPKIAMSGITWQGGDDVTPDADGILMVRNVENPTSATVASVTGPQVTLVSPKDYRSILLQ